MSPISTAAPGPSPRKPLYRKLRPRPNGPPREDIVANQRARLHGAMVEALAASGYDDTSVAQLCRLAGVSKRTFYEQFENKDACFAASYKRVISSAVGRLAGAWPEHAAWEEQVARGLDVLLHELADQPKSARLVLVEGARAGRLLSRPLPNPRPELQRIVAAGFTCGRAGWSFPPLLARGIVCGLEQALRAALLEDRLENPSALAASLTRWVLDYGTPTLASLTGEAISQSGGSLAGDEPSRTRVTSPRARILRATAELVAADGLEHLTLSRIACRVDLDEETVSGYYPTADACFAEALNLLGLEVMMSVAEVSRDTVDSPVGVCLELLAFVDRIVGDPVIRGVLFRAARDGCATSAEHQGRRFLRKGIEALLARHPSIARRAWIVQEATAGALWGAISDHARQSSAHVRAAARSQILTLAVVPFLGAEPLGEILAGPAQRRC